MKKLSSELETSRTSGGRRDSQFFSKGPLLRSRPGGGQNFQTATQTLKAAAPESQKALQPEPSPSQEAVIPTDFPSPQSYPMALNNILSNFPIDPSLVTAPVGGHLSLFLDNWAVLTQDVRILHVVKGYSPEFLTEPRLQLPPHSTHRMNREERKQWTTKSRACWPKEP